VGVQNEAVVASVSVFLEDSTRGPNLDPWNHNSMACHHAAAVHIGLEKRVAVGVDVDLVQENIDPNDAREATCLVVENRRVVDNNQHQHHLVLAKTSAANVVDSGYLHQERRTYQPNVPCTYGPKDLDIWAQCRYPKFLQGSSNVLFYGHREHRHDVGATMIVSARNRSLDSRDHGL
jgi:hypothetical protein